MAHICSCAYGGAALAPIMQSLKLLYIVSLNNLLVSFHLRGR